MFYSLLFYFAIVSSCLFLVASQPKPVPSNKPSATGNQAFELSVYSDNSCTNSIGTVYYQLNTCVANGDHSVNAPYVKATVVTGNPSLFTLTYYTDSTCSHQAGISVKTQSFFNNQCLLSSGHQYGKGTIISSLPSSPPSSFHGLGLSLYTTSSNCKSNSLTSAVARYEMSLNSCILVPGHFDEKVTLCDSNGFTNIYYSSKDGSCSGTAETNHHSNTEACVNDDITVDYLVKGYMNGKCYRSSKQHSVFDKLF
jgi:hypothetical protein